MNEECLYCELGIHGNCQRGSCSCNCKGDRDYFMRLELVTPNT